MKPLPPACKIHHVNIQHDYVYIQYNYVTIEDDDVNMQLNSVACQYDCVASWQEQIAYLVLWNDFKLHVLHWWKGCPNPITTAVLKLFFLTIPPYEKVCKNTFNSTTQCRVWICDPQIDSLRFNWQRYAENNHILIIYKNINKKPFSSFISKGITLLDVGAIYLLT